MTSLVKLKGMKMDYQKATTLGHWMVISMVKLKDMKTDFYRVKTSEN